MDAVKTDGPPHVRAMHTIFIPYNPQRELKLQNKNNSLEVLFKKNSTWLITQEVSHHWIRAEFHLAQHPILLHGQPGVPVKSQKQGMEVSLLRLLPHY